MPRRDFLRHIVNRAVLKHGLAPEEAELIRSEVAKAEARYGFYAYGGKPEALADYLESKDFENLVASLRRNNKALEALREILKETLEAYRDVPRVRAAAARRLGELGAAAPQPQGGSRRGVVAMLLPDRAVTATVAKDLVKAFREKGDLASRLVSLDLVESARASGLEAPEYLLALAMLEEEGSIALENAEPSLELEKAAAAALARLDVAFASGDLENERYRRLEELVRRFAGSGPSERLAAWRLAEGLRLLRALLCRRAAQAAAFLAENNDPLAAIAVAEELKAYRARAEKLAKLSGGAELLSLQGDSIKALDKTTAKATDEAKKEMTTLEGLLKIIESVDTSKPGEVAAATSRIAARCGGG